MVSCGVVSCASHVGSWALPSLVWVAQRASGLAASLCAPFSSMFVSSVSCPGGCNSSACRNTCMRKHGSPESTSRMHPRQPPGPRRGGGLRPFRVAVGVVAADVDAAARLLRRGGGGAHLHLGRARLARARAQGVGIGPWSTPDRPSGPPPDSAPCRCHCVCETCYAS